MSFASSVSKHCLIPCLAVVIAMITSQPAAKAQNAANLPTPTELLNRMTRNFSPAIPPDVDPSLQKAYESQKRFAQVQLQFDIVSWESFVALCWPTDKAGKPQPKVGDPGAPVFNSYPTVADIFDPSTETAAALKSHAPRQNRRYLNKLKTPGIQVGDRVLSLTSSTRGDLNLTEVGQAFSYPLWDQNGYMLRYEILVNDEERTYILDNGLQTFAGQAAFSQAGKKVDFPSGAYGKKPVGAIEVKLGWKVLHDSDDDSRFLTADATIITNSDPQNPTTKKVKVGLVGMHIAHKSATSPQWIWSTFSHVDALSADALSTNSKTGKPLKPLFTNPSQETLPVNVPSATKAPYADGLPPTQVLQLTPIPLATQQVNRRAQAALHAQKSVLQYYELLNTQWPTNPSAPPTPGGQGTAPGSIANKSGGNPTPVYLVNPLFETYFQLGNQAASAQEENATDTTQVFGTESCVGCHSSAPVATSVSPTTKQAAFGGQLTGDFSWLLSKYAH